MSTLEKITIVSKDRPLEQVTAMFNPKEISIDKQVPWSEHDNPKANVQMLEFTNAKNRTMSFELFFDGFEDQTDVHAKYVSRLLLMTEINPVDKEEDRHPPRVVVTWGKSIKFQGVIESLGTKYTMFLADGTPVRATCSIKFKEVDDVQLKKKGG